MGSDGMAGATAVGFAGAGTALTDVAGGVALGATAVDGAGDGRAGVRHGCWWWSLGGRVEGDRVRWGIWRCSRLPPDLLRIASSAVHRLRTRLPTPDADLEPKDSGP